MQTHITSLLTVLLVAAASLATASPQTGTRITLNAVAFDSHDQIVGDLTSQDFQISDQGKPQRIVSFHRNADPQAALNNVPNTPQAAPPVVILFDLENDDLRDRGQGTDEIIHALEHLELSDSLYLYLLTREGRLKPVRGLPSPQEDNPPEKTPWTQHIKPLLEVAMENVNELRILIPSPWYGPTLPAIEALSVALKPFPGRKNLIWMTHGLLGGGGPEVNQIATTLDRNGITLSSVDQRITDFEKGTIFEQFAQLTGGKVYANDIKKAVKEAMAASTSGYIIEYDAPRADGKYHKIRLMCSRKGVRLQVKQGYYAN